jgi:hypothetical protein
VDRVAFTRILRLRGLLVIFFRARFVRVNFTEVNNRISSLLESTIIKVVDREDIDPLSLREVGGELELETT